MITAHITKVAAIENATEIWVYDPSNNTTRVLNGLLDVTAVILSLAVKVCPLRAGLFIYYPIYSDLHVNATC
jgi:hypothetical protein